MGPFRKTAAKYLKYLYENYQPEHEKFCVCVCVRLFYVFMFESGNGKQTESHRTKEIQQECANEYALQYIYINMHTFSE